MYRGKRGTCVKLILGEGRMNKIISYVLFVAGVVLVVMSLFYIFRIVHMNLWEDVIFRIVSVMAFIGGGVFIGLSRALKNQDTLIQLMRKQIEDDTKFKKMCHELHKS